MSGRYARLKPDWLLRGWSDIPRALVNWRTGEQHELKPTGFYVAESCDGRTDFDSLAFLPEHHGMLDWLLAHGIAERCPRRTSIEPWQRYRQAPNPRVAEILWAVTGRCNLQCRHCFMESPGGRYGELPLTAMLALLDQFKRANVIDILLTGGEPFARRDLLDIIGRMAEQKIHLRCILSNGLLITDRHLRSIKGLGFRPDFQISFDGMGAHDAMRGMKGAERGAIDAIRRVRAAGLSVTVATSLCKLNLGCLAETYELMKTLDIETWRLEAPHANGNWRGTTIAATLDEQARALAPLAERWVRDGSPFAIVLGGFFHGARPGEQPRLRGHQPDEYDCAACREKAHVLPDGTLIRCPRYVDTPLQARMPNLLRSELSKVWKRSVFRRLVDRKKKEVLAHNPECAACGFFGECGMGCRALALTETGSPMAKDPITCELFKKGYRRRFLEIAASKSHAIQ